MPARPPQDEDHEAAERGAAALCRFVFPGYVVDRLAMARAVLAAANDHGAEWMTRLPTKQIAVGEGPSPERDTRVETWLNAWVDRHDAGDMTDDETLAVFAFIAELRAHLASGSAAQNHEGRCPRCGAIEGQPCWDAHNAGHTRAPHPERLAARPSQDEDHEGKDG